MFGPGPLPFGTSFRRCPVALRSALLVALVAAASACSDTVGLGSSGPPDVEVHVDTAPPVDTKAPSQPTLVMLVDGDEPVVDVARAVVTRINPAAGARLDSIVPLEEGRGFVVPLTSGEATAANRDERVAYAEEPLIVNADGDAPWMKLLPARYVAGGTRSPSMAAAPPWALDRMTQRALPLDNAAVFIGTGAGVTIYIIDTGILDTHAEYAGRVTKGPDYINGGTVTGDCNGHGTMVASDAAGATVGVARQAKIVAVRVLGCNGSGSTIGIIQAIDWVTARARAAGGPAVINMSLGAVGGSFGVNEAVARATTAGVTVVVAAGNSNADACGATPASAPSAITVGATDVRDARAAFSNFGSCVDLYAPGAGVAGASASGNGAYVSWSGTSASAPFVAGVAALYLEESPRSTPAQVAAALVSGATPNVVTGPNATPNRLVFLPGGTLAPGTGGTPSNAAPTTFVSPPTARSSVTSSRATARSRRR
jgi:subtilisin family serine protease